MKFFTLMTKGGYALMDGEGKVLVFAHSADAEAHRIAMGSAICDTITIREVCFRA